MSVYWNINLFFFCFGFSWFFKKKLEKKFPFCFMVTEEGRGGTWYVENNEGQDWLVAKVLAPEYYLKKYKISQIYFFRQKFLLWKYYLFSQRLWLFVPQSFGITNFPISVLGKKCKKNICCKNLVQFLGLLLLF
jgi:hypothetical protein